MTLAPRAAVGADETAITSVVPTSADDGHGRADRTRCSTHAGTVHAPAREGIATLRLRSPDEVAAADPGCARDGRCGGRRDPRQGQGWHPAAARRLATARAARSASIRRSGSSVAASSGGGWRGCSMRSEVRFHDPRLDPLPAIADGDLAILCHPDRARPAGARRSGERGASVVTVGDDFDDAQDLLPLGAGVRAARHDARRRGGDVAGPVRPAGAPSRRATGDASTRSMSRSTARPARRAPAAITARCRAARWRGTTASWADYLGGSGRELCWFPEPVGAKDCYRADIADPLLLHAAFPRRVAHQRPTFGAPPRPFHGTAADAEPAPPGGRRRCAAGRGAWRRTPTADGSA